MRSLLMLLASSLLAASCLFGAPASAADVPLKAWPARPWGWSGFYAGASLGARWVDNDWTSSNIFPLFGDTVQPVPGGAMDSVATRIGGYAGYNWQVALAWLIGIETDLGWGRNSKAITPAPGTAGISGTGCGPGVCTGLPTAALRESWDGSLRGRVGTLITPDPLLYATGGLAIRARRRAARQAAWTPRTLICSPGSWPGNSYSPGRARIQYARRTSSSRGESIA